MIKIKTIFTKITGLENLVSVYVKGIGIQHSQEPITRENGLHCFQWLYSFNGEGTVIIYGKEYTLNKGDVLLLPPGIEHKYYSSSSNWTTYWIQYDGTMAYSILDYLNINGWYIAKPTDSYALMKSFENLYKSVSLQSYTNFLESSSKLLLFLVDFYNNAEIHYSKPHKKIANIQKVIDYMENNFGKALSLEDLSSLIDITPQHLCRMFQEIFHMTPLSYLTQIRLKEAKQLLIKQSNLPVKDIAASVGYYDVSYFCNIFKNQEKMTPTEFRKIYF